MTLVTGDQIEYVLMLKDEQQRDNVYNQIQTFNKKVNQALLGCTLNKQQILIILFIYI